MKRLFLSLLLVLTLSAKIQAQSQVTVTGTIQGATSGKVNFNLIPWTNAVQYFVPTNGPVIVNQTQSCGINSSGQLKNTTLSGPCLVWGNDVISPGNTTYTVVFYPNGTQTNSVAHESLTGSTYLLNAPVFAPVVNIVPQYQTITTQPISVNLVPAAPHVFTVGTAGAPYSTAYIDNLFTTTWNPVTINTTTLTVGGTSTLNTLVVNGTSALNGTVTANAIISNSTLNVNGTSTLPVIVSGAISNSGNETTGSLVVSGALTASTISINPWTLSTTPAFNITQTGANWQNSHATSQPTTTDFRPMVVLDLSNPTNGAGGKDGIYINNKMTSSSGTREAVGIWVDQYTLPDNGGAVSGIHVISTGSGDGIDAFHNVEERPVGYALQSTGYAAEFGGDTGDGVVLINMKDNSVDSVVNNGQGIVLQMQNTGTTSSGLHIVNVLPNNVPPVGQLGIWVSNNAGTATMFSVALGSGDTVVGGAFLPKKNAEFTNTHGVYWDLPDASQAYAVADNTTGQLQIQIGDGVGSGGTIGANFINQSTTSILQVLVAGGIAIPASSNQVLLGITPNTTLLTFPPGTGQSILTFGITSGTIAQFNTSDGKMLGKNLGGVSDYSPGNPAWINCCLTSSIAVVTANVNASRIDMFVNSSFVGLSVGHTGTGTTVPYELFVDATVAQKFETSGTDRTCIYINGALRLLSISGGAVIDGGACP